MGWGLAGVETLSLHGRPLQTIIPFIQPNQRLLILTDANSNPQAVAELLTTHNYGNSKLSALSHLGSPREKQFHGLAKDWKQTVPAFHTLAVHCIADKTAIPTPKTGLPDGCFTHDGTMTKQDIRAITLAKLIPLPRARLWDVGCGCGSVAIEWMRGARGATAIGIEPREDRRALTAQNALALGTPTLDIRAGHAPRGFDGFTHPRCGFYWRRSLRGDRRILPEGSATIGATGLQCGDLGIRTNIGGFIHAVWRAFNRVCNAHGQSLLAVKSAGDLRCPSPSGAL